MRSFQVSRLGSRTSIPIPADVDGAPSGPWFPGPIKSLTIHRSPPAIGVVALGVPVRSSGSPFLNDLTSRTFVSALPPMAVLRPSSQDIPAEDGSFRSAASPGADKATHALPRTMALEARTFRLSKPKVDGALVPPKPLDLAMPSTV